MSASEKRWSDMPEADFKQAALAAVGSGLIHTSHANSAAVYEAGQAIEEWALRGLPLAEMDAATMKGGVGALEWCADKGRVWAIKAFVASGGVRWERLPPALNCGCVKLSDFVQGWLAREWVAQSGIGLEISPQARLAADADACSLARGQRLASCLRIDPASQAMIFDGAAAALAAIVQACDGDAAGSHDAEASGLGLAKVKAELGLLGEIGRNAWDQGAQAARESSIRAAGRAVERERWIGPLEAAFLGDSVHVARVLLDAAHAAGVDLSGASHPMLNRLAKMERPDIESASLLWRALSHGAAGCAAEILARGFETGAPRPASPEEESKARGNPFGAFRHGWVDESARELHCEVGLAMAKEALRKGWVETSEEAASWVERLAEQARPWRESKDPEGMMEKWDGCILALATRLAEWRQGGASPAPLKEGRAMRL